MRLLVFGATGGTGRALLDQGLALGHQMTAFVRNPGVLEARPGLTIVQGDVTDAAAVNHAVAGHEAILSALGHAAGSPACCRAACRLSSARDEPDRDQTADSTCPRSGSATAGSRWGGWPARSWCRCSCARRWTRRRFEEGIIHASDLDWILTRPGGLEDGPRTGVYRCITDPREKVDQPRICAKAPMWPTSRCRTWRMSASCAERSV